MYKIISDRIEIKLFIKLHAKTTTLIGISEQGLTIALHAKPINNAANNELIIFLSELFDIPKSQISLLRGSTSRHKWVNMPINHKIKVFFKLS